jgi:hypothetical protein
MWRNAALFATMKTQLEDLAKSNLLQVTSDWAAKCNKTIPNRIARWKKETLPCYWVVHSDVTLGRINDFLVARKQQARADEVSEDEPTFLELDSS